MKTFETEKHNIPEGATHYCDETSSDYFAWFKGVESGNFAVMVIGTSRWVHGRKSYYLDLAKPIPQTKEVEWVNGDTVEYHNKHEGEGGILTFVGIHPTHKDHAVLYGKHLNGGYMSAPLSMLSKPETEAERVERERVMFVDAACWDVHSLAVSQAIALFDAGYRKES
jgi:hypothetical protein